MHPTRDMEDKSTPLDDIMYCEPGRIFCRTKEIMLAVDGSEGAARAATVAYEIAEMTGSKLFIIHVIPTATITQFAMMSNSNYEEVIKHYTENGKRLLEGYKSAAAEFEIEVELLLEQGSPSERIISLTKEKEVDLVVLGSRGIEGGRRAGMGGSTERVVLGAECPVIIVK